MAVSGGFVAILGRAGRDGVDFRALLVSCHLDGLLAPSFRSSKSAEIALKALERPLKIMRKPSKTYENP